MTRPWVAQLALVLRGLYRGYPPPLPFAIVSMVVTGAVTVGWRTALAALSPQVTLNGLDVWHDPEQVWCMQPR